MTEKTAGFDGEAMRERLNADGPLTLGIEEELMLLHPETLDLAPVAGEVLDRLSADARFKPELAAAQVELLTEPCEGATHALRSLTSAR
jgi:carboxylate-amine ligase